MLRGLRLALGREGRPSRQRPLFGEPTTSFLTWCSGHPAPLHRSTGRIEFHFVAFGVPLGGVGRKNQMSLDLCRSVLWSAPNSLSRITVITAIVSSVAPR